MQTEPGKPARVESIEALEAIYDRAPSQPAMRKVAPHLTSTYRRWIMASRFCVLTTVGPAGTDGSPRGDEGPVVQEIDAQTLAMPDWRGNNRLDSLRNIVVDGRVSLLFMVPGSSTVVRVNGTAWLTQDTEILNRFSDRGRVPKTVIMVDISEVYTQCARAIIRAGLWTSGDESDGLPTPGDILTEMTGGDIDGAAYDRERPERAAKTMW